MTHFIATAWNWTRTISEVCLKFRAMEVAMKRLRAGNESKGLTHEQPGRNGEQGFLSVVFDFSFPDASWKNPKRVRLPLETLVKFGTTGPCIRQRWPSRFSKCFRWETQLLGRNSISGGTFSRLEPIYILPLLPRWRRWTGPGERLQVESDASPGNCSGMQDVRPHAKPARPAPSSYRPPHARDFLARQCLRRSPALKASFIIWLPFRITWRAGKTSGCLGLTSKQLRQNLSVENQQQPLWKLWGDSNAQLGAGVENICAKGPVLLGFRNAFTWLPPSQIQIFIPSPWAPLPLAPFFSITLGPVMDRRQPRRKLSSELGW